MADTPHRDTAPEHVHEHRDRHSHRFAAWRALIVVVIGALLGPVALASVALPAHAASAPSPQVYVGNVGAGNVTEYGLGASGNTAPTTTLPSDMAPGGAHEAVAVDASGRVYAGRPTEVVRFEPRTGGITPPPSAITGPDTGLSAVDGLAVDAAGRLYVANAGNNTVTEYAPDASGDATPVAILSGLSGAESVAVDAAGQLYVGVGTGSIVVFAPGAGTGALPVRTLGGSATGIDFPAGLAFDRAGRLHVLSESQQPASLRTFAAGASGNVAPVAVLTGPATGFTNPRGIAVDSTGSTYVTDEGANLATPPVPPSVRVFASGAMSNATPTSILSGSATGLNAPTGIAVATPLFITAPSMSSATTGTPFSLQLSASLGLPPYAWSIPSGALPAGLTLSPAGLISGTPSTPGSATFTVKLTDSATPTANVITRVLTIDVSAPALVYVANSGFSNSITEYPVGSAGNVAPSRTISGADTGLSSPTGLALDRTGRLFVANFTAAPAGSITEYAPGASGDAVPIATLAGPHTGIVGPRAVAVDDTGKLYVANEGSRTVTQYAPGASGDAAPTATITGLDDPAALSLDGFGNPLVGDANAVKLFAAGASGNAQPAAILAGSHTQLDGIEGLVLTSQSVAVVSNANTSIVTEYSGIGDDPPSSVMSIPAPWGLAADASGQTIYAVSAQTGAAPSVLAIAANGTQTISGAATQLDTPRGIAVGPRLFPTMVTLTSSPNPSVAGKPVTFTAAVTPLLGGPTPAGPVTFILDGSTLAVEPTDSSGQAKVTAIISASGNHTISARFAGSTTSAATGPTTTTFQINKAPK